MADKNLESDPKGSADDRVAVRTAHPAHQKPSDLKQHGADRTSVRRRMRSSMYANPSEFPMINVPTYNTANNAGGVFTVRFEDLETLCLDLKAKNYPGNLPVVVIEKPSMVVKSRSPVTVFANVNTIGTHVPDVLKACLQDSQFQVVVGGHAKGILSVAMHVNRTKYLKNEGT
eukprot:GFYU01001949.1.p1 GENE.GFYU01001949.1~~GFYU01001949.1.p1  ORF type:complete len:173 (-),score=30.87 GFYU01001949.1:156-674(-)